MNRKKLIPKIGLRNLKTAISTTLCALIYFIFDESPAFACIGAIFGMGGTLDDSFLHGGNRFFGTVIGGFLGMGLFAIYLVFHPEGGHHLLLIPLMFIGTILLILICQVFWVGGIQPGGVVMCLLLYNTPPDTFVAYTLARIFDTGVGVIIAIIVNRLLSREKIKNWLSSKSIDDTDITPKEV